MKVTNTERRYVQVSSQNEFHTNQSRNVDSATKYSTNHLADVQEPSLLGNFL